jgi:hypothetical protein
LSNRAASAPNNHNRQSILANKPMRKDERAELT